MSDYELMLHISFFEYGVADDWAFYPEEYGMEQE